MLIMFVKVKLYERKYYFRSTLYPMPIILYLNIIYHINRSRFNIYEHWKNVKVSQINLFKPS